MKNQKKYFLIFSILLFSIFVSGCGSVLFGKLGIIDVKTNPSGANIFIDGVDTCKTSPCVLGNVTVGRHVIEAIYSEITHRELLDVSACRKTEINIDFSYKTELIKIKVLPPIIHITLSQGNTAGINSVTAYYRNGTSKSISISNCNFSSSNIAYVNVNKNGIITGNSTGAAVITVSYTENDKTVNDSILVYVRNTPEDSPIVPNW